MKSSRFTEEQIIGILREQEAGAKTAESDFGALPQTQTRRCFTRECLALIADTSLPGLRVVRELHAIVAVRGRPAIIVSDNGTELTSRAVLRWAQEMQVEWHYIDPGKPQQNPLPNPSSAGCATSA